MHRTRRRRTTAAVVGLERRELLTLSGTWLGQDGHDLVGLAFQTGPDGIQDIHMEVSGLKAGVPVASAEILPWGGGVWWYNGPPGSWAAAWVQPTGSTTADVYVNPYTVETGRSFFIAINYSDGTSDGVTIAGGSADPNLWMPSGAMALGWDGQDGHDLSGDGPGVGPDGIQDAHLTLANLQAGSAIVSATLTSSSGQSWAFGTNPALRANAELVRPSSSTTADLFFDPLANLAGQSLTLTIAYDNGKTSTASLQAGPTDPTLAMPSPAPIPLSWGAISAAWVGQDGIDLTGRGDVHVAVSGIPAGRRVVSAVLSDQDGIEWSYASPANPDDPPLGFRATAADPSRADLSFPPARDETGATLTLRLVLDDGSTVAAQFAGGAVDLGRRAPAIAATSVVAHPGDDLGALANQYGTVHLSAGTYLLNGPLVLKNPVTITADPGAVLMFSQGANDPPWTTAIKVMAGNTTLDGFAVRFAGPIAWNEGTSYGPAVIGGPDNFDPSPSSPLVAIALSHLDLESPPVAATATPGEAPRLIRMVSALSGVVADNTLKGGTSEFFGGPWRVTGNTYLGTVPNTTCSTAFAFHNSHDLVLEGNTARPVGPSGKTWRFLVMTQAGTGDLIADNTVVGIGPQDDDTLPNPNAVEVILTEAYRLHFEGYPAAISPDGQVVQVTTVQGDPVRAGDVVAILSGPDAGQWRRIDQVIGPSAFLLDAPLPAGRYAISIATGFVGETFQGNTVDTTGSSVADDLVLAGDHFGTRVIDNTLIGGSRGLRLEAAPTEAPVSWGWSHAPFLGGVVEGNTIEDVRNGALIAVDHGAPVKTNAGRVYMSLALDDNTFAWSDAYLATLPQAGPTAPPLALTVGQDGSADPGELLISAQGNEVQVEGSSTTGAIMQVVTATLNGQPTTNQAIALPPLPSAPANLHLVDDTGASASDGITSDGLLAFDPVATASGYEYSLTGADGSFQTVTAASSFLPAGLVQGSNTVFVRAFDASGRRGPPSSIAITYDTTPPPAVTGLAVGPGGLVQFQPAEPGDVYEYSVGNSGTYLPLGTATSFTDPTILNAPGTVRVRAVDPAGNVGPVATASVAIESSPGRPEGQPPGRPADPQPLPSWPDASASTAADSASTAADEPSPSGPTGAPSTAQTPPAAVVAGPLGSSPSKRLRWVGAPRALIHRMVARHARVEHAARVLWRVLSAR
jgi:hypothetical protein